MTSSPPTQLEGSAMAEPRHLIRVSVIVPVYNGEVDISELAPCLLAQTVPADQVEYLLVDNNSSDRTAELLQDWQRAAAAQGIRWQSLSEPDIQSSYAARNRGIHLAQGEFLVFTDADCRPEPKWLENLITPFSDSTVGLVAGEILARSSHGWLEEFSERRGTLNQRFTIAHEYLPYGQTANLAIRRQALLGVGLFRPYLTTGGDADLCWRIQQHHPWRIVLAENAVIRHRHRATLKDLASQWRRYGRSNRYLHELHGVPLRRNLSRREIVHQLGRWILKELPKTSLQLVQGKAAPVDLISPLLDLYCVRARAAGQRDAQLPDAARQIEPFEGRSEYV